MKSFRTHFLLINTFFNNLDNTIDKYTQNYQSFLFIGDFNNEDFKPCLSKFVYNAENIDKEKACLKAQLVLVALTFFNKSFH